jgi:hypothetical protein
MRNVTGFGFGVGTEWPEIRFETLMIRGQDDKYETHPSNIQSSLGSTIVSLGTELFGVQTKTMS